MTYRCIFQPLSRGLDPGKLLLLCLVIGALLISCSGYQVKGDRSRGVYHRVKKGETLSAIARAYHINLQELAEINNISKPDQIEEDSVIFIPDADQVVDDVITAARSQSPPAVPVYDAAEPESKARGAAPLRKEPPKREKPPEPVPKKERPRAEGPAKEPAATTRVEERDLGAAGSPAKTTGGDVVAPGTIKKEGPAKGEEIRFEKDRFIWPVMGKVISRFGIQPDKTNFNGIRISAASETAVRAAAAGKVINSLYLKNYGETIIIEHDDNYATVYTHLGVRTVQKDVSVKKGDRIAFLGKADDKGEPYLIFEIRHKSKARNPLFFLP
jgi:lipoprotein NlpD